MINEILLRRRNKITLDYDSCVETDNIQYVATILKNVNDLGFTFSEDLIQKLRLVCSENIKEFYLELIPMLKTLVGANVEYNPFYKNFPEEVMSMSDTELFVRAIIAYWTNCEVLIREDEKERLPLFDNAELKVLDLGTETDIIEIMNNLISSKTSLSQQDKDDLVWLLNNKGLDFDNMPEINFKENLPIITKLILDNTSSLTWLNSLKLYYKTATDVLRLAVWLSDGDVSLAKPTKFKSMSRKMRRLLVQLLNNCGNIEEDMLRHEMAWIRLGEMLHVGEYKQYTKVQTAFDKLRNNGKIETFGSKVDAAIKTNRINDAINLLKNRPGELARMLDFLIRKAERPSDVINTFCEVADKVSVPVLLQVREHFAWRTAKNDCRVFFPKGSLAKAYTIKNELPEIDEQWCSDVVGICEAGIIEQFKTKEPMGKVYIADCMKNYLVPQSQRSVSKVTTKVITRGSRLPLRENTKATRAFIYWTNCGNSDNRYDRDRVDIDLSAAILDENFGCLEHVSYTHLRSTKYKAVHSGDITNGGSVNGDGVSEFLDVDIDSVVKYGGRYVIYQVYSFTGQKYSDMPHAMFGFMEREDVNSGEIYEAKTVEQKMDLTSESTVCIPVIFDCVKREFIWLDMAMNITSMNRSCANLEGNLRGVSAVCYGIVNGHKPTMATLAELNVAARGTMVDNRNDADVIIDTDTTPVVETITKHIEVQNEKGEVIETRTETEEKVKDCKFITPFMIDVWQSEML